MKSFLLTACVVFACRCVISSAWAEDFPEVYNNDTLVDAEPLPPEEAAKGMQVPEGFRVNVFAAEPDVQNPIAMTWDSKGRMWIAENYTYAERAQRFDLNLRDRVVILDDSDGDGVADKRTVFTDQVQMLTGIEVGHGGVWLMCPPQLLFIPDRNGDDIPDGPAKVILDGFTVSQENYHNFANGLRWGPNGWLYGRCGGSSPGLVGEPGTADEDRIPLEGGIWRTHPRTRHFEVLMHGTTNPWGHDWNEYGEGFFINTVNGHLWHMIPGAHFVRPFTLDPNPSTYEMIDMHADHWHFDTNGSWTKSRDGAADSFGGGHAHVGMMIYQGDNWPEEYRGKLFTWNIHGRRANQEILERDGSGYVGRHGKDMMLSNDLFFRGMELSCGPDGTVYAIDWSDTGECHEHTGVHRTSGRVFRIAYKPDEIPAGKKVDLSTLASVELVKQLNHKNIWRVRQAQRLLSERSLYGDSPWGKNDLRESSEVLKNMPYTEDDPVVLIRGMMALHSMNIVQVSGRREHEELLKYMECSEHVRAAAIRLMTDDWPIDDVMSKRHVLKRLSAHLEEESENLLPHLCEFAAKDESGLVRLTLASTLQRLPVQHRAKLADALMQRVEDTDDHNLPLLVWYGLIPIAEHDPQGLADLAVSSKWPKTQRFIARRISSLIDEKPEAIERILAFIATTDDSKIRLNLLEGISDGLEGWSRAEQPKSWEQVVAAVSDDDDHVKSIVRDLSVLFGDGRALEEVRAIVLDDEADNTVRLSALQTLVAKSEIEDIRELCISMLSDARFNTMAARGLSKGYDPEIAIELVKNYRRFRGPDRPQVIEILVSRTVFAKILLDSIAEKKIPAADLTAFDVRQIRSLNDESLQKQVAELWGEIRESPAEKRKQIDSLKEELTAELLAGANPSHGRVLFDKSCANCHKLFGQGESIGPELTGANRNNMDYLLENIVDPSAVVSKDFRMTIVDLHDGRTLNGLVLTKTEKILTLQTQTEKKTIAVEDIDETTITTLSPMPDGVLDNLTPEQIRDLISYLQQPAQVRMPDDASK